MALRREDLYERPEAVILDFPTRIVRARTARARRARAERRLALWAAALVATVGIIGGSALSTPSSVTTRPGSPEAVTVQAGETVWDLATRYAPHGSDPRALADAILELNGIQGVVAPGTEVRLP